MTGNHPPIHPDSSEPGRMASLSIGPRKLALAAAVAAAVWVLLWLTFRTFAKLETTPSAFFATLVSLACLVYVLSHLSEAYRIRTRNAMERFMPSNRDILTIAFIFVIVTVVSLELLRLSLESWGQDPRAILLLGLFVLSVSVSGVLAWRLVTRPRRLE